MRLGRLMAGIGLLLIAGCGTTVERTPAPFDQIETVAPYGLRLADDEVRFWGDRVSREDIELIIAQTVQDYAQLLGDRQAGDAPLTETALALSGGGPDGAFGAGLLKGLAERGERPDYTVVTGVSTGAIIALFAFLGPEYDGMLEEIYTSYSTDDLVEDTIFSGLTGGPALSDVSGYRALIERYIDDMVVAAIADRYRSGKTLLIGSTNLDAVRPVIWNVGAIAASGHPDARRLIHDIVQASSAIPGAFPPVLIPVETEDGRRFDEMHVDGGATQQVLLFSPSFSIQAVDERSGLDIERTVYVVLNNKIQKSYSPVDADLFSIAGTAVSSLLVGSGSGDVYRFFAIAQRDGIDLQITSIPQDFDSEPEEPFDPTYMRALYDLGYETGRKGVDWSAYPPDFVPWPSPTPG
ncbi:MAG: patatin-like phospholipase family protein [Pseudomonadota bacterium]